MQEKTRRKKYVGPTKMFSFNFHWKTEEICEKKIWKEGNHHWGTRVLKESLKIVIFKSSRWVYFFLFFQYLLIIVASIKQLKAHFIFHLFSTHFHSFDNFSSYFLFLIISPSFIIKTNYKYCKSILSKNSINIVKNK
jgi:hypothetical protein